MSNIPIRGSKQIGCKVNIIQNCWENVEQNIPFPVRLVLAVSSFENEFWKLQQIRDLRLVRRLSGSFCQSNVSHRQLGQRFPVRLPLSTPDLLQQCRRRLQSSRGRWRYC